MRDFAQGAVFAADTRSSVPQAFDHRQAESLRQRGDHHSQSPRVEAGECLVAHESREQHCLLEPERRDAGSYVGSSRVVRLPFEVAYDTAKAQRILGWTPLVKLADGLQASTEWMAAMGIIERE